MPAEDCPICFDPFESSDMHNECNMPFTLECRHTFHRVCIRRALKSALAQRAASSARGLGPEEMKALKVQCPVCKADAAVEANHLSQDVDDEDADDAAYLAVGAEDEQSEIAGEGGAEEAMEQQAVVADGGGGAAAGAGPDDVESEQQADVDEGTGAGGDDVEMKQDSPLKASLPSPARTPASPALTKERAELLLDAMEVEAKRPGKK